MCLGVRAGQALEKAAGPDQSVGFRQLGWLIGETEPASDDLLALTQAWYGLYTKRSIGPAQASAQNLAQYSDAGLDVSRGHIAECQSKVLASRSFSEEGCADRDKQLGFAGTVCYIHSA